MQEYFSITTSYRPVKVSAWRRDEVRGRQEDEEREGEVMSVMQVVQRGQMAAAAAALCLAD